MKTQGFAVNVLAHAFCKSFSKSLITHWKSQYCRTVQLYESTVGVLVLLSTACDSPLHDGYDAHRVLLLMFL